MITPVFALVMLSNLAYFTAIGMLIPTLPRYVEGPLEGGNVAVGFVIGSFAASAVLLRPFAGRIGDERGRRILIVAGGAAVGISVLGYMAAESLGLLIGLRVLSGVGEALFYVGVASVINDLAPDERRAEALSYFSLALFGGLALGPVIGETALHAGGYDATWLAAAISAFLAAGLGLIVPETRPEIPKKGERKKMPLVHPAALQPGTVLAANIWGLATVTSFLPLYVLTLGMDGSRGVFAFHSCIVFAVRLFGARIPDRLGPARASRFALIFTAIGLATIGITGTKPGLFVGVAIWSIGHSLAFPALMSMAIKNAPPSERGQVVGTFTAFFDLSFGVGAVSAGWIAELLGYRGAFVSAAFVAVGGLVLLYMRARARRRAGLGKGEAEEISSEAATEDRRPAPSQS